MKSQIIFGTSVLENELPQTGKPLIDFSGVTLTGQRNLELMPMLCQNIFC